MHSEVETASPSGTVLRALKWSAYCSIILLCFGILFVQFLDSDYFPLKIFDSEPQVPCYFIFGDSLADNGNNNNLTTLVKSNYQPYGVDFPEGPTGRFTNNRLIVDIIAELLGFDDFIPPFANLTGEDILKGVNYASAGSGIRNETGKYMGQVISMDEQLRNHLAIVSRIIGILKSEFLAKLYLEQCVYTVITGSNDYINNYFMPAYYNTSKLYTPEEYAEALVDQFSEQLKTLHSYGARKVAVFGLGLLSELPEIIERYGSNASMLGDAATLFNADLQPVITDLNIELTGAKFTYINSSGISSTASSDSLAGLNTTGTCCQTVSGYGTCTPGVAPCTNRTLYAFFDGFHPTEVVNEVIAGRAYKRTLSADASPYDISQLTKLY